eukprot:g3379.t1
MSHVDTDTCKTQQDLVCRLESSGVLGAQHSRVANAFRRVDRALFVPERCGYAEPYTSKPQPLGFDTFMAEPEHHAIAAIALEDRIVSGASVLDLGTGSGYLAALFAALAASGDQNSRVVGIDRVHTLVDDARNCVQKWHRNLSDAASVPLPTFATQHEQWAHSKTVPQRFDAIHVGFGISAEKLDDISAVLKTGGRLLAPVFVAGGNGEQWLSLFEKVDEAPGKLVEVEKIRRTICQPMEHDAFSESETTTTPGGRRARLERVQEELLEWKREFTEQKGRAPSSKELTGDPRASSLFEEFRKLRVREWDHE